MQPKALRNIICPASIHNVASYQFLHCKKRFTPTASPLHSAQAYVLTEQHT